MPTRKTNHIRFIISCTPWVKTPSPRGASCGRTKAARYATAITAPEPQRSQSTRRHAAAPASADGPQHDDVVVAVVPPQQEATAVSPPPQQEAARADAGRGGGSPGRTKPPVSQDEAAARAVAVWLMSFMSVFSVT